MLMMVASCGPIPVYYRSGSDVTRLQQDTLSCDIKALKDAPVANEIRQRPPVYYPGRHVCSAGQCWTRPGYWMDGGTYTVDVNQGLRARVQQSCMASKGYQRIELPQCRKDLTAGLTTQSSRKQPALSETSCVIRLKDGSSRVMTPL